MKHRPLVALSSAAILAVYAAGYVRTRSAADRFATEAGPRRAAGAEPPRVEAIVPQRTAPSSGSTPAAQIPPFNTPSLQRSPRSTTAAPDVTPAAPVASDSASSSTATEPAGESQSVHTPAPEPAVEAAPTPLVQPPQLTVVVAAEYKDGTYLGWGYCRHGDIQASVVVENGRIASATIARCLTRYSCSWIELLPGQVVTRQSPEVDYVSGATESSDAFHDAVADALAKAK
jgi:uncharacterized protein with FMN-binding domain